MSTPIPPESGDDCNCSEWNCISPSNAINRTKNNKAEILYINDFVANTAYSQKICGEADIIVVERNLFGDTLTMIQYWKGRNKTVLAIFDDGYHIMHPQNISYGFWMDGELKRQNDAGQIEVHKLVPHPMTQFKWGLKMVKGVQVPSQKLADDWSSISKTYYVHNYLEADRYQNVEPMHKRDEKVIGWCGSLSHHSSFTDSGVLDALRRIARKRSDVFFLISGDQRLYEMLETKKKMFQPFVPREQWTSLVKSLDIGLAPLSGEFDKCRSWIKALEYMALKIPWIGTDYPTYTDIKEFGFMVNNGMYNWENAINEVLDHYPDYKKLADNQAYEFAMEQTSDKNIEKVTLRLYEKLINEPYP
jgi:glycosyltransferase involved in cell wall biosynthesis